MTENEGFEALHAARPGAPAPDPASAASLRRRIIATAPSESATPAAGRGRLVRLASAGVALAAVAAAAFAFAPAMQDAVPGLAPVQAAYAAVRTAVAKTAASSQSGTIVTSTIAEWVDGRDATVALATTLKWSGDDFSLRVGTDAAPDDPAVSLYVGGRFYEKDSRGFVHYAESDNGADPRVGAVWVDAARKDVSGERLEHVVRALQDLEEVREADGSTSYVGHATAEAIAGEFRTDEGLPYVSRPFVKLGDPATPVRVKVTVGTDGMIRSWTCSYSWDGADWVYNATYKDLGSTTGITAPDPSKVRESDGTRG